MGRPIDRLLFVYNADSGTLNALVDSARNGFHAAMRAFEVPF